MRRIFAFVLGVILLLCVFSIAACAEEALPEAVVQETIEEAEPTITESVVAFVKEHLDTISAIVTMLGAVFYSARKHGLLNKSIGTVNNNAVTIAENSAAVIKEALEKVALVSSVITEYGTKIDAFLEEVRESVADKAKLAGAIEKVESFLELASLANTELANEVAELLVLANIPPSKKEELYARHLAAVKVIDEKTEVIHHDGEEA